MRHLPARIVSAALAINLTAAGIVDASPASSTPQSQGSQSQTSQSSQSQGTQSQTGETAAKPAPDQSKATPQLPPANLDRIRRGLSREPTLVIDDGQARYYLEILAKLPRIEEIIGKYDLMNGPTRRGAPMTHQEFLAMVTPKEMYGSAGIKPAEMLQFALVNWLGQAFVKRVVEDLRNAHSEREIQAIRDRIDRELAALKGKTPQ